jgi:hypothetical protein
LAQVIENMAIALPAISGYREDTGKIRKEGFSDPVEK